MPEAAASKKGPVPVERTRCTLCRNPIKPHQAAAGPAQSYHADCWPAAEAIVSSPADQQQDYRRKIGEQGLAGLLAPYLSVFPPQQQTFTVKPQGSAGLAEQATAAQAVEAPVVDAGTAATVAAEDLPGRRYEPNFVRL